ncbi:hypothetical protein SAMN05192562_10539 [Kosakonia arachidis]|uniref:Uncharacterized protein n=1 Tax=Kosakonia arachidis TaxID=551989 RepID=A0A1I7DGJ3_9ENTR|nr:hypothetical protein [Kosakonia arachidis]SFU10715.1 hypothetical protein SAMN05192562_10539 [Kosakonia arachidis]
MSNKIHGSLFLAILSALTASELQGDIERTITWFLNRLRIGTAGLETVQ